MIVPSAATLRAIFTAAGKVQNGIHVATGVISPVSAFSGADGTVLFVR